MLWKSIIVFLLIMLTAVSIQAATCGSEPSFYSCQDGALSIEETPMMMLVAVQPLSGNVLEQACRDHAGRALRDSQEWERSGCSAKLHMTSQLFSLDYNTHLNRCKVTLGTAISDDRKGREDLLAKCRGTAPPPPPIRPTPPPPPPPPSVPPSPPPVSITPPTPPPPSQPGQEGKRLSGVWEIGLLDLKTLQEYRYTYSLTFTGNQFEGKYLIPGNNPSKFQGFVSSDGSRIQYTQVHGSYRGNFAGRKVGADKFEGAVCDSQGNIFLFTLNKR